MKTKILNLLAALALTAAALATPSAFGFGAYANAGGTNYGIAVDADSPESARLTAIANCVNPGGGTQENCAAEVTNFQDRCLGLYDTDTGGFTFIDTETTRSNAHNAALGRCDNVGINFGCDATDVVDLRTEESCDHTCVLADNEFIVDNPEDNAGCRPARDNTECGMVDSATPYFDDKGDEDVTNDDCRAADDCSGDSDGVLDTETGRCVPCTGQVEFNEQCLAACTDNKTRLGTNTECVCATTQEQVNGEGDCVDKCDETTEMRVGETCMPIDTGDNGGDIDLTQRASDGLVDLAVSGSPGTLSDELDAADIEHTIIGRNDFTDGVGTTTPNSTVFITCPSGRAEYLAPRGIELANGTKYAMVEPFCYPDHFIVQFADGRAERWDVGSNEGHRLPFLVTVTTATSGDDGGGGDGDNPVPVFMVGTGGNNLQTTPETRHEVAFNNVTVIQITVATTVDGFTYTKIGESSEQLEVGMEDGVVGFNTTVVPPNNYQIFVAATESDNIVATISVYLTVAAADGGGNDGNNGGTVAASSGGGGGGSAGLIIGGVVVGGILIYVLSGGTADDVFWSPQYAFEWHNGKSLYSYGSRWDYHKENLNVYWTAANNTAGDWQYGSGATWHGDILTASYDSIGDGTMADADLSLMAHKTIGNWALQSGIRSNIQIQESGTSTSHRVNAEAIFRRDDDWKVSTVIGRYDRYFSVYMLFTKKL